MSPYFEDFEGDGDIPMSFGSVIKDSGWARSRNAFSI
jgi:hypothetical protein